MTKEEFWNNLIDRIIACEKACLKDQLLHKAATYDLIVEDLHKVEIEKEITDNEKRID